MLLLLAPAFVVVEEASTSAAVLDTAEATSAAATEWRPWAAESAPGGVKGRCGGRGWLCAAAAVAAAACWVKCCRW